MPYRLTFLHYPRPHPPAATRTVAPHTPSAQSRHQGTPHESQRHGAQPNNTHALVPECKAPVPLHISRGCRRQLTQTSAGNQIHVSSSPHRTQGPLSSGACHPLVADAESPSRRPANCESSSLQCGESLRGALLRAHPTPSPSQPVIPLCGHLPCDALTPHRT